MRIIAGSARRIQLEVADGSSTRPFLEMARGALFNSLADAVLEADVLDVFAGSGALGLEALSRGAATCVFVERDPRAAAALKRNIARCGMAGRYRIVRDNAERALSGMGESFDLAFFDPPFADVGGWRVGGAAESLMRRAANVLRPGGVLVFRMEEGGAEGPEWPELHKIIEKHYGRSRVCRYRKEPNREELA